MSVLSRLTAAGLLAGVLSMAPVHAQQQQDTTTAATPNTGTGTVTQYDEGRRGFDWGWLGLLGLFGLLGLRRPTNVSYQDRDRTYQDRTSTR